MSSASNTRFWTGQRWRLLGWGGALILLTTPWVAMQFSREVNWSLADFVLAALIFAVAGTALELSARASASHAYRGGATLAVLSAVLLVWVNGAVGIIGSENNPANLMFAGVLAIAVVGAVVAGFRPLGLARAMLAAAAGQAAVALIALGLGHNILPISAVFIALWLGAALLFAKAVDP